MAIPLDADRYSDVKLALVCQKCRASGLIPIQHLDRVLYCRGCASSFRVEPGGLVEIETPPEERIAVQVRSSSSQWQDHRAVIQREPSLRERLSDIGTSLAASNVARAVALCGIVGVISGLVLLASKGPAPPVHRELPTALPERAALLTEALATRDMEVLIGLTDPSQHRALRIWLAHGKDLPQISRSENPQVESAVLSAAKTTAAGDVVDVRVRLRTPADAKGLVLVERWVKQSETWFFRPVRMRAQPQPIVRPAIKQKQRVER